VRYSTYHTNRRANAKLLFQVYINIINETTTLRIYNIYTGNIALVLQNSPIAVLDSASAAGVKLEQ